MASPNHPSLGALIDEARRLERDHAPTAGAAWSAVLRAAPGHPEALYALAQGILLADPARAIDMLAAAERAAPRDARIPLAAAQALDAKGDFAGKYAALERALAADPYCFPALLQKASMMERTNPRQAALIFRNALKITPPDERLPPPLRALAAQARAAVDRDSRAMRAALEEKLTVVRARHAGADFRRFDHACDTIAGLSKIYRQEPTMLDFPELPPIEYYPREMFPWLPELEAATDVIVDELKRVIQEDDPEFFPYVNNPPGAPLNQWAELNSSRKWSAYFLWKDGRPVDAHCLRCPQTAEILSRMPLAGVDGFAPSAFFSTLDPGAHIPAHTGVTNTRLVCHLPLIIPDGAAFRVGAQTRPWKKGEAWVFDDTIEHEAWNRSRELRVILIFDIWNPLLTEAERDLVSAMMSARRAYYSA